MSAVNGIIEAINFRPINADGTPDQWGKTHRTSMSIGGTYYGGSSVKASPRGELQLRVQNGKDWVTLEAGDQVQFFTKSREVSGKTYYNVEGKIMLVAKGNGPAPAAAPAKPASASASPAPARSAPAGSSQPSALDVRIEDGQVFNNVMSYMLEKDIEMTPNNIKAAAVLIRKCLLAFRAAGCGREVEAAAVPAALPPAEPTRPTPPPPPAPAVVEFDDADVPF